MFHGWGYLLSEIFVLIALAALIGLFIGWLIWGRQGAGGTEPSNDAQDVARLRSELEACQSNARETAAQLARLERDATVGQPGQDADTPTPAQAPEMVQETEEEPEGTKPTTLDAPRGGQADDLKKIKGIGPKLEGMCNQLGFWHFDQIANWSDEEIAWVDVNLQAFKGRVTRDNWVEQARELAAGSD